jgi:(p)ppGpp synthase/HD superfamily hydrolase
VPLTERYDDAMTYAAKLHRLQTRKGTTIPYLSHLLAVSSLVLEAGGDEELAIAGLLHDSLEDQPDKTSYEELVTRFGSRVADIVRECSDAEPAAGEQKPPWKARKEGYIAHLESAPTDVLMVSRADKLPNARSIAQDARSLGDGLWPRFNASKDDQFWYYDELTRVFSERFPGPQTDALAAAVMSMKQEG